ncbi:MAG: hypothetical protein IJJ33_17545 [Victivallales bacterium]|nr:hypothetical protein [Victivallales bacterium]
MNLLAFLLIVGSALFHATWNLLAKRGRLTVAYYAVMELTTTLCWSHVLLWSPVRLSKMPPRLYLFVLCSTLCDGVVYVFGLSRSYRYMEMATAYPLMRSLPILLTAFVTTVGGLGTALGPWTLVGFLLVFCGALLMPLMRFSDFNPKNYLSWSMGFVLLTALGTTGYTIFDSFAVKEMSNASPGVSKVMISLTYASLRSAVQVGLLWAQTLSLQSERTRLAQIVSQRDWTAPLAGVCCSLTYVLVLGAMTQVTNVSYVQAFRQLGLPFGMLAGVLVLKEKAPLVKWVGVSLIVIGLAVSVLF